MAYYVWLNDQHEEIINQRQWPMEIGEWTETVPPIIHKRGWQVIPGSYVCEGIPWRFLPATLYRVEVEGEESVDGIHTAWERARLVECYGTLYEDQAVELAVAWSKAIVAHYQHPTYYRSADQVSRLSDMERLVEKAQKVADGEINESLFETSTRVGHLPLIYMAKAINAAATSKDPLLKWVYTLYIPSEMRSSTVKLDLARVLSERLKK